MTIGTSIICGSFGFIFYLTCPRIAQHDCHPEQAFFAPRRIWASRALLVACPERAQATEGRAWLASSSGPATTCRPTCHTPPRTTACILGEGRKWSTSFFRFTRTDDKEIRGSSRCGFYSGFYRGPHPVSIAPAPLRPSASIAGPRLQSRALLHRHLLQFSPHRRCAPAAEKTSHRSPPAPAGPPAAAEDPSSSDLPSSCPAPPAPASRAPVADRSAGPPETPEPRRHCASPGPPPACLWLRARHDGAARLPYSRESVYEPDPGCQSC